MKVGDLLCHKRRGWLALALSINERNMSVEFMWLDEGSFFGPNDIDYSAMCLFEVINASR